MSRLDRVVLIALAVLLSAALVVNLQLLTPPMASLHDGSDQQSHMASAIAFPQVGFRLNSQRTSDLLRELGSSRPGSLPFNWQDFPRPYPPGAWIYAAPEAFLHELTSIDQTTLNRISNFKFLLATTFLIWLVWKLFAEKISTARSTLLWAVVGLVFSCRPADTTGYALALAVSDSILKSWIERQANADRAHWVGGVLRSGDLALWGQAPAEIVVPRGEQAPLSSTRSPTENKLGRNSCTLD